MQINTHSKDSLECLCFLEGVFSGGSDSEQVLEALDNGLRHRGYCGEANTEAGAGDGCKTMLEGGNDVLVLDVQHLQGGGGG